MKKALSILLCITLMINVFSTASSVGANTSSTPYKNTNLSNTTNIHSIDNLSWSSSVKEAITYLSVDQTGYYNMSVTDHAKTSTLEIYLTDLDLAGKEDLWYDTYTFPEFNNGFYSEENLYLIASHTYKILLIYRDYDYEDENHLYHDANVSIRFDKTDYTPKYVELDSAEEISINDISYSWFEFKSVVDGDYHLDSSTISDTGLTVYNKDSGELVAYLSLDNTTNPRMFLEADTNYIVKAQDFGLPSGTLNFSISKAQNNVSKLEVLNSNVFLSPYDGEFFDGLAYLDFDQIENLEYKITYSDKTTEIADYDTLLDNGIIINKIDYMGNICEENGEYYFEEGLQPFSISFNGKKDSTYIYIISYEKWDSYIDSDTLYDKRNCGCHCCNSDD